MPDAPPLDRPLRKDAARNRSALLAAAKDVFAAEGIDVRVEEIARHAGLGVGTLYRHFPTKDALVLAIFEERLEEFERIAAAALEGPDAAGAVRRFLEGAVEVQARDRAFKDVVAARLRVSGHVSPARVRLTATLAKAVRSARAAGGLRADVTAQDVLLLLLATGRIVEATETTAPGLWRRYVALFLDGLAPEGATRLPRPSLSAAALEQLVVGRARPAGTT